MKKILVLMLAAAMVMSMAACSAKKETGSDTQTTEETNTNTQESTTTASGGNLTPTTQTEVVASSGNLISSNANAEFICGGNWVVFVEGEGSDASKVLTFKEDGTMADGNGWDLSSDTIIIFDSSYKKVDTYTVVEEYGTIILERDNTNYGTGLDKLAGSLVREDAKDAAVKQYSAK